MFYSFFFQNVGAADSLFFVALSSKIWGSNKQKTKKSKTKEKRVKTMGLGYEKKYVSRSLAQKIMYKQQARCKSKKKCMKTMGLA